MKEAAGSKDKKGLSVSDLTIRTSDGMGKWFIILLFFGVVIVAMIVSVFGLKEASKTFAKNENQTAYISIAMDILKDEPQKQDSSDVIKRAWAVDIFNRYAPIKLDSIVQRALIHQKPLVSGKEYQEIVKAPSGKATPELERYPTKESVVFLKVIDDSTRGDLSYVEVGIDEINLVNLSSQAREISTDRYGTAKIAVNNTSIYDFTINRPGYKLERTQITGAHLFRMDTLFIQLCRNRELF
ncbi:hypothetical protein JXO52_05545 [bacterium]|nr:hypothetical protein [bacterium]